jgi:hypothetical protein
MLEDITSSLIIKKGAEAGIAGGIRGGGKTLLCDRELLLRGLPPKEGLRPSKTRDQRSTSSLLYRLDFRGYL